MEEFSTSVETNLRQVARWVDQATASWPTWATGRAEAPLPLGLNTGDPVHVWSNPRGRWIEDGVVQGGTPVDIKINGSSVPAGSLKVAFDQGAGVQWIMPTDAREMLRKVPRPRHLQVPHTRTDAASGRPVPDVFKELFAFDCSSPPAAADLPDEVANIERSFHRSRQLFIDGSFPMEVSGRVTSLLRPDQITRHEGQALTGPAGWTTFGNPVPLAPPPFLDWQLFRGIPRSDDVVQGEMGDCWFLSSLAALAEFQEGRFVRALLPGQDQINSSGAYLVRLCLGGRWRDVLIDDRFPCMGGGKYYSQLAYCVTNRRQLWASLVEKAYAKICGSYESIRGGEASEALEMLTGWPCSMIIFERPDFDADMLWASLCSARDAAFLMTCSTKSVKCRSLETDHVYSLMDVYEVAVPGKGRVKLLKIRNPHSKSKWQGTWSDASLLWTPHLRRQLGCPEGGNSQVFFMELKDFLEQFAHCTICRIRSSEWHEARELVQIPSADVPCTGLVLEVFETAECSISLVQPGERLRGGPCFPDVEKTLACVGFVLLRLDGGEDQNRVIATAQIRHSSNVSVDCWLPPGRHLLVPLSLHRGATLNATWSFVSSRRVRLKERTLSREAVRNAWMAYAKDIDPNGILFHGARLHLGKADAGSVVVFANNCTAKHFNVDLAFQSGCLHYSRSRNANNDWLLPGHGQIVQIAQPFGTEKSPVSWSEMHTFKLTPQGPQQQCHNPPVRIGTSDLHAPFLMNASDDANSCVPQ